MRQLILSLLIRIYTVCHFVFDFRLKPLFALVDMSQFSDGRVYFRNLGERVKPISEYRDTGPFLFQIDTDGSGFIDLEELSVALDTCGLKVPGWQVRNIISDIHNKGDVDKDGKLSMDEFKNVTYTINKVDSRYLKYQFLKLLRNFYQCISVLQLKPF